MLTIVSDRWTSFFFDKHWWSRAWQAALKFAPACIPASVGLTLANVTVVFATAFLPLQFRRLMDSISGATVTNGTDLSGALVFGLVVMLMLVVVVALSIWALGQWLLKLTAFARAFCWQTPSLDASAVLAAEEHTKQRGPYIMKLWLLASLYLLLPAFPLSVLIALHSVFSTKLVNIGLLGWPSWASSLEAQAGGAIAGVFLTVVCTAYTFVTIVFSAVSDLPPWQTASQALMQSLKHFMALSALTVLILAANIVVTAPQMLLAIINSAPWAHSPFLEAGGQIWLGITSPVVWPLSVAPFCQMTKQIQLNSHD